MGLFEASADLVDAGLGARFVQIAAGRAADADGADRLIASLDANAALQEQDVRQFGKPPAFGFAPIRSTMTPVLSSLRPAPSMIAVYAPTLRKREEQMTRDLQRTEADQRLSKPVGYQSPLMSIC
jgi:hypothetical protein